MALSEKTVIGIYLQTTIAVLAITLVFMNRAFEGFQTAVPSQIQCIAEDKVSQCRFVDPVASTKTSWVIREWVKTSTPQFKCPSGSINDNTKTPPVSINYQYTFNLKNMECVFPTNIDRASLMLPPDPIKRLTMDDQSKIYCGFGEEYYPGFSSNFAETANGICVKTVGTIPRCIEEGAAVDSDSVTRSMRCYSNRYSSVKEVFGQDVTLLYNHYKNIGRYNLMNPCCDETVADTPSGSIRIFGKEYKKDWKFWTLFGVGCIVVLGLLFMMMR